MKGWRDQKHKDTKLVLETGAGNSLAGEGAVLPCRKLLLAQGLQPPCRSRVAGQSGEPEPLCRDAHGPVCTLPGRGFAFCCSFPVPQPGEGERRPPRQSRMPTAGWRAAAPLQGVWGCRDSPGASGGRRKVPWEASTPSLLSEVPDAQPTPTGSSAPPPARPAADLGVDLFTRSAVTQRHNQVEEVLPLSVFPRFVRRTGRKYGLWSRLSELPNQSLQGRGRGTCLTRICKYRCRLCSSRSGNHGANNPMCHPWPRPGRIKGASRTWRSGPRPPKRSSCNRPKVRPGSGDF